jgi:hypothetical protein
MHRILLLWYKKKATPKIFRRPPKLAHGAMEGAQPQAGTRQLECQFQGPVALSRCYSAQKAFFYDSDRVLCGSVCGQGNQGNQHWSFGPMCLVILKRHSARRTPICGGGESGLDGSAVCTARAAPGRLGP